jgi:hypothetical protein
MFSLQLYVCVIFVALLYTALSGFQIQAWFVFLHCVFALAVVVSVIHESGHAILSIEFVGE